MHFLPHRTAVAFRPNNFDLVRLLAALQVVFFHCINRLDLHPGAWSVPISFFHGVPIFFVASGFMVSASYERQQGNLKRYFKNRALRILPGLWVCLLVTVIVTSFFGFRPHRFIDFLWLPAQMVGLIYTPPYLRSFGSGVYNGALWTIPLELQFYIVLPAVYLIAFRKRSNRMLLLALACFTVLSIFLAYYAPVDFGHYEPPLHKLTRYSFLPQFYLFLYGVVLQRYRAFQSKWIAGKALYWALLLIAFCYLKPDWPAANNLALLLLGTTAISAAYTIPSVSSFLKEQDISYGVYVYHGLIINVLVMTGHLGGWRNSLLLFVATILIASCSWHFVERPILRSKQEKTRAVLEPAL